jgi:hypothetical protein
VRSPDPAPSHPRSSIPSHPRSSIEELLAPQWPRAVPACLWMGAVLAASVALSNGYSLPRHVALGPVTFPLDLMPVAILVTAVVWGLAASLLWRAAPMVMIVLLVPVGMDSWVPLPPAPLRYALEIDTAIACGVGHMGVAAGEEIAALLGGGAPAGSGGAPCLRAADDVGAALGDIARAAADFAIGAAAGFPSALARPIAQMEMERLEGSPQAPASDAISVLAGQAGPR